jgi:hypothetical protein
MSEELVVGGGLVPGVVLVVDLGKILESFLREPGEELR